MSFLFLLLIYLSCFKEVFYCGLAPVPTEVCSYTWEDGSATPAILNSIKESGCSRILSSISFTQDVSILTDLENIVYVDGSIDISDMDNLVSLSGLQNLGTITENLYVRENDLLNSLSGLDSLRDVASILISNNFVLQTIGSLNNVTNCTILELHKNDALLSIDGFANLETVNYDLHITENNLLSDITSFQNLNHVKNLLVSENPNLNLEIFQNLNYVENLFILYTPLITNLMVFSNIANSLGFLSVVGNFGLKSLSGLNKITQINEWMQIKKNPNLLSLEGLENMESVGWLSIEDNISLENIYELSNVNVLEKFWLERNTNFLCSNRCNRKIIWNLKDISVDNSEQCGVNGNLFLCLPEESTCDYGDSCLVCGTGCNVVTVSGGFCGDNILDESYEECDNGTNNSNIYLHCLYNEKKCKYCSSYCTLKKGITSYCGDGIVDKPNEECDPAVSLSCGDDCRFIVPDSNNDNPLETDSDLRETIELTQTSSTISSVIAETTMKNEAVSNKEDFKGSSTENYAIRNTSLNICIVFILVIFTLK